MANISIVGRDYELNKRIAQGVADRLSRFYLSFTDLILYNAYEQSRETLLASGGQEKYQKFLKASAKAVSEYCDSVIAVDSRDLDGFVSEVLSTTSQVAYLAQGKKTLKALGVSKGASADKRRYKGFYRAYIKADGRSDEQLIQNVIDEISGISGGQNDKI